MTQDAATTAKKIRADLKSSFKTCKFSVKTRKYSMGQAIDISWTDGVSYADVHTLIKKVEAEYKEQGITIQNERSSFIFLHRFISIKNRDAVKTAIIEELIENPVNGLQEWDLFRMINDRLESTTFF